MVANQWGFLRIQRVDSRKRPVTERLRDWRVVLEAPPPTQVRSQAARCMDCGVPFCNAGCPLANRIPDWNELVARDNWRNAIDELHATNNFPEFTGWLCPAPCEPACVLAIDDKPVAIKQIELAIINRAWAEGWVTPVLPTRHTGRRVAVVGSGPGGLAAAQQLARAGHQVTVFERDDRAGGLLRYGIPDFKMAKDLLDRRLEQLEAEGVQFMCGVDVGRRVTGDDLRRDFEAIVLACGALAARELPLEGRDLHGIHQAMDYLPLSNRVQLGDLDAPPITAEGKHVVIIGGGDTAADCLGTANRQRARSVTQLDHNPRPPATRDEEAHPWPTWPKTHKDSPAYEEGVDEEWGHEPIEFVGDVTGHVAGVRTVRVEKVYVPDGRQRFMAVPGTEGELPAELVLLAAGFVGTEPGSLLDQLGVRVDESRGTMLVDESWRAADRVYACGDATRGASLVVWAIAEGRSVAAAVDAAVMGTTDLPAPVEPGQRPL